MTPQAKYRTRSPNRQRAYGALKRAIAQGRITKPKVCEKCGRNPGVASDGRSLLHGHHDDYSRPLDVLWICNKCHKRHDGGAKGASNGNAKLTEAQIQIIREAGHTDGELANKFGVHISTVFRARRGLSWSHVDAPASTAREMI